MREIPEISRPLDTPAEGAYPQAAGRTGDAGGRSRKRVAFVPSRNADKLGEV